MRTLLVLLALAACSVPGDDTGAPPDAAVWPMFRHDAAHSGVSEGVGAIDTPCIRFQHPLAGRVSRGAGGPVIGAVDGEVRVFVAADGVCEENGTGCSDEGGSVWSFSGDGAVRWRVALPSPADPYAPLLADIDGDGGPELVVPALDAPWIRALDAGTGNLVWEATLPSGHRTEAAPTGVDFDGDGVLSILIGTDTAFAGTPARYLEIDGASGQITSSLELPRRSDEDTDCEYGNKSDSSQHAVATVGGRTMAFNGAWNGYVYALQAGAQGLEIAWSTPLPTDEGLDCSVPKTRSSPVVADLDADGDLELAFGWMYDEGSLDDAFATARLQILDATTGAPGPHVTTGIWKSSPAAVDLDPDTPGLELVAGRVGGMIAFDDTLDVLWEEGPAGSEARGVRSSPAIVDVDGDGDLDVVAGVEGDRESDPVGLYAWDGATGSLLWSLELGTEGGLYRGASSSPAVGDVDGDGEVEIALLGADGVLTVVDGSCP